MKTVKLNVFEEQRKWIKQHHDAGATLTVNDQGEVLAASLGEC